MAGYRARVRVLKYVCLLSILFSVPSGAFAQLGKHLRFAQIAFGGGYETVVNVANGGTSVFNGKLTLLPSDRTKPFPALINGTPVSGGADLSLDPGATASLRITSGDASAGTLSGFAVIDDNSSVGTDFLEGNLTYYVKTAEGTIVDSVGVAPSTPVRRTVIPFDDFQTVALALANHNAQTATATLTLFDDKNVQAGTATQTLATDQQVPSFLYQFFPGVNLAKGRVEIESNLPLLGTALTFVKGGQASSLPFLPAIQRYDVSISVAGSTNTSQVYLTVDGSYVTGNAIGTKNGVPQTDPNAITPLTGILQNGNLLIFAHPPGDVPDDLFYVLFPGFNPSQRTQSGTAVIYFVNPPGAAAQGTITLTAIN